MPLPPPKRPADAPLINEDADRLLGRIILRYGALTFVLLIVATVIMTIINAPLIAYYHLHLTRQISRVLSWDAMSILIVLIPFFLGINRLFAARLRLGRELVQRRAWREAAAALEPFAGRGQRFLDSTGEAHYLLAQAYAGAGQPDKAEDARAFVRRHRPGAWADKLRAGKSSPAASVTPAQEKRPRPSNPKRRRRF